MFIARAIEGPRRESKDKTQITVESIGQPELNIVGSRVDEAVKRLDQFIDRAVVQGVPQAKIVHGVGTGRLMQAVRERLSDTPYVKAFHADERNAGVTVVEFS
jgi:DNA mismatch repair protein MutS2